ncbi:MAG: hypothetical protein J7M18_07235 [Candidatus Eremiobacteraeota bacterium]|nr:hypothetical protein [Candidatus Eremiobacteraeota bacterium]
MDKEKIKNFARQLLGCTCPDEVFENIEYRASFRLSSGQVVNSRINIGNRLLIYIIKSDDPGFIEKILPLLFSAGKKEKDSSGFNRFRLVILTDKVDDIKCLVQKMFDTIKLEDEKIHLHVIDKKDELLLYDDPEELPGFHPVKKV